MRTSLCAWTHTRTATVRVLLSNPLVVVRRASEWLTRVVWMRMRMVDCVTGSDDCEVKLWDLNTEKNLLRLTVYTAPMYARPRHWLHDVLLVVNHFGECSTAVSMQPGSNKLLATGAEGPNEATGQPGEPVVRLWDCGSNKLIKRLENHSDSIYGLDFDSTGTSHRHSTTILDDVETQAGQSF